MARRRPPARLAAAAIVLIVVAFACAFDISVRAAGVLTDAHGGADATRRRGPSIPRPASN